VDGEVKEKIFNLMREGALDEVINMFKLDEKLHPLIIDMIRDESMRIRTGGAAILEELVKEHKEAMVRLIPMIAGLLKSASPMIRGDGAYLLGVIKHKDALPFLLEAANDSHQYAREIIRETIDEIEQAR
jgi:HEAT repeat protein